MGRNRTRKVARHQAHMPLTFPKTLDLEVRAQHAAQLQLAIGEFLAGLLVNGEPLTMALSVKRPFSPDPDQERVLVSVYWYKTKMDDLDIHTDVLFMRRCLKCGNYLRGEEHTCEKLLPYPSPPNGEGDDLLDEIKT